MRKLLMLAVAMAFAVASQAATFDWSASQVRQGWNDSTLKADGTAYLFMVGVNSATEAAVASAISGATSASALATTLSGMAIGTADVTSGGISGSSSEVTQGPPATLFIAVISSDGYAYQSATQEVTAYETLGGTTVGFGSQKSATSSASAWKNVGGGGGGDIPEPTSGLLLLVGAGMLALRRKQK